MNDLFTIPDDKPAGDTPVDLASVARVPGIAAGNLVPGMVGNFLTPQEYSPWNVAHMGIVTSNLGGLGKLLDTAGKVASAPFDYLTDKLGLPTPTVPRPAFIDELVSQGQQSVDRAKAMLPESLQPAEPTNWLERGAEGAGQTIGSMIGVPLPTRAITALPKVAQPLASFAAPLSGTLPKAIPLGVGSVAPFAASGADELLQTRPQTQISRQSEQPQPQPGQPRDLFASQPAQSNDLFTTDQQQPEQSGITGGDIVGGIAAATLAALAAKYHVRTRLPATQTTRYATDADRFNTAMRDRAAGDPAQTFNMEGQPTAPLAMSPTEANVRAAQTQFQDRNATLDAHFRNLDRNNQDIIHQNGYLNNDSSLRTMIDTTLDTGYHQPSGIRQPSIAKALRDVSRLTDDQREVLNRGLWSGTVMDGRLDTFNRALSNRSVNDPRQIRTQLYNTSDETLRHNIAQMNNDPVTREIADRFYAMGRADLDIMEASGYPKDAIAEMRRVNQHYIPIPTSTGDVAPTSFHFREHGPYIGSEIPYTTPWDAMFQYKEKLYHDIYQNGLRRTWRDASVSAQNRDPNLAKMFVKKVDYLGRDTGEKGNKSALRIYEPHGEETWLVGHPAFADALSRNPTQVNALLASTRRLAQAGTTRPLALALGQKFFPAVQFFRSNFYLPTNTPRGGFGSPLDKALGRATGLWNPSIPAHMLYSGGADAAARIAWGIHNTLEPASTNIFNMKLRRMLGNARVDKIRQQMHDQYMQSQHYERASQGAAGGMSQGYHDIPLTQHESMGLAKYGAAGEMAPRLYGKNPFTKAAKPYYTIPKKILNEAYDIINDMGPSSLWRLNRDNPNWSRNQLIYETRNLMGDVGTKGAGRSVPINASRATKVVGGLGDYYHNYIPFANATTQDIARMGRQLADQPVATPLRITANLGLLAAGSLYTAMHVPGALHHLFDQQSTTQRNNPTIYGNDENDPTKNTVLSLPQNVRGAYAPILDLLGHATEAWNARGDENAWDRAYHTLSSMLSHHISRNTETAAIHGLSQAIDPYTSIPPAVNTAVNAVGRDWAATPDRLFEWGREGFNKPIADVVSRSTTGRTSGAPNVTAGDSISAHGPWVQHMLSSVLGIAGGAYETVEKGYNALQHGDHVLSTIGENMWQRFKDQNPSLNTLFNNSNQLARTSPLAERNYAAIASMQNAGTSTDIRFEGQTRRLGVPLPGPVDPKINHDPVMQGMADSTRKFRDDLSRRFMQPINDLKKLQDNISRQRLSEPDTRARFNDLQSQIDDKHIMIAELIDRHNKILSRMAGYPVDVRMIDWSKDHSQFD